MKIARITFKYPIEFLGPRLSSVPPEYVLAAAGVAGIAGPEAVGAVLLYYGVVVWGPYGLDWLGDWFDSLE